jgi:hypothetical protein
VPRLIALLASLCILVALPAAATAAHAVKPKPTACSKAKTAKAKRKHCIATKKCLKAKSKKARAKYCKPKPRRKAAAKPNPAPQGTAPAPAAGGGSRVAPHVEGGPDDVVVIAVLDSGFNPYHWDFDATRMPQNSDGTTANDLPLDRPADEWLPGFTRGAFTTFEPFQLSLDRKDPDTRSADLLAADDKKWAAVKGSSGDTRHAVWFPGTKVIGGMTYGADGSLDGTPDSHGTGTTSSVVGNLHGTCPECLLFFVNYGTDPEGAINWAMQQPWIDAISNSYGLGSNPVYGRDRIYSGSDTELQRKATERGQSIFFSAGNGIENAFVVPNQTTFSSQEGPDWIVTVGAVEPGEDNYYGTSSVYGDNGRTTGSGRPADVAGIGSEYPTAYTSDTVGGTGTTGFGGTSNATPQITGLYGHGLYLARRAMAGPSRAQGDGVIARGAFTCGAARPGCELGDGVLTNGELRTRLFHGARRNSEGPPSEEELMATGHGFYAGREQKDRTAWNQEFERILAPLEGRSDVIGRAPGELEWMIVDSYCRQRNWGSWGGGYYVEGKTELPGSDPAWPIRSARAEGCPGGPVAP